MYGPTILFNSLTNEETGKLKNDKKKKPENKTGPETVQRESKEQIHV